MLNHREIEIYSKSMTPTQKKMLLAIADYNEGWISEENLENKLRTILKVKK
ncbi:MAG: hypothetical protein SLAVMIC_00953 [uncultured marine phage]|uniref:Uncharacterized protein n=1 Tax=uncultured marine phage TaxID=707152 RepID=A0A8D9C9T8_9VIRU|nr:MAG: hypothetical protein SLAVMIC_00953 [uncultured marine phage]